MHENILPLLAGIVVLGVVAQWAAWRVGLPSILLLLSFGLIAGPVTGWIDPDHLFGDLLLPVVSLSVAVILFEGGLTLKMSELRKVGSVVRNLVSVGVLVTWGVTTLAAHYILKMSPSLSALIGGVLVVTGPTVIGPLLRSIRPTGAVGPVLRWEGIVIDPVGALLTILIFEVISIGADPSVATAHMVWGVVKTVVAGGGLGALAAGVLTIVLARYWIADYLQNALSLMLVMLVFAVSNAIQHESGLLAVTVMGFVMANQKRVDVADIIEFKENLQVLLISVLFIVLAARLEFADVKVILLPCVFFVAVLVFVARPLSVFVSTWRSGLSTREKLFLSWMAPRGIVAAAIASVLALRLESVGHEGAELLVPVTFVTIILTVALYGLSAPFVARYLGVAESNPQGLLLVGAHAWSRAVGTLLQKEGFKVVLVDTNREHVATARMEGLTAYCGSALAEHTADEMDLGGVGRMLAVTPNDWVNVLTVRHFERVFGKSECFQLAPYRGASQKSLEKHFYGRWLFDEQHTFEALDCKLADDYVVKATRLSEEFDFAAYRARYGESALPMFVKNDAGQLRVLVASDEANAAAGETLIGFVKEPPPQNS